METIICKECHKELSKKAEICPNCGCRVKKNPFFRQLGIVFLGIIIFIIIVLLVIGIFYEIRKYQDNKLINQYSGIWKLENNQEQFYTEGDNKIKILLDKELIIDKKNVYYGMGGLSYCENENEKLEERCSSNVPKVLLSHLYDDKVGINFTAENGEPIILCFKLEGEKTMKQISCKNVGQDKINPEVYSANGGIDEELEIVYEKK